MAVDYTKLFSTGRDRLMYRPIVLQNFCDFWYLGSNADRIALLAYVAPLMNRWLDRSKVVGDAGAMRSALLMLRLMRRLADWSEFNAPLGGLAEIVKLYKRLSGLTGAN